MARKMEIASGRIGPVIFYIRNGKQCARSAPASVRQTEPMKKRGANFSIASRISSTIRKNMPAICSLEDGTRHSRLTGAFSRWLKTAGIDQLETGPIPELKDFGLNPSKMLGAKWKDHTEVIRNENGIVIKLSSLDARTMMAIPKHTRKWKWNISSITIPLDTNNKQASLSNQIIISSEEPVFNGTSISHELPVIPGSIILTGYSIECLDENDEAVKVRKGFYPPAGFVYAEWCGLNG